MNEQPTFYTTLYPPNATAVEGDVDEGVNEALAREASPRNGFMFVLSPPRRGESER